MKIHPMASLLYDYQERNVFKEFMVSITMHFTYQRWGKRISTPEDKVKKQKNHEIEDQCK